MGSLLPLLGAGKGPQRKGKLATLELEDSSGGAVFSLAEDKKPVLDGILQPLSSGADPSSGLEVPLPPGGQRSVPW